MPVSVGVQQRLNASHVGRQRGFTNEAVRNYAVRGTPFGDYAGSQVTRRTTTIRAHLRAATDSGAVWRSAQSGGVSATFNLSTTAPVNPTVTKPETLNDSGGVAYAEITPVDVVGFIGDGHSLASGPGAVGQVASIRIRKRASQSLADFELPPFESGPTETIAKPRHSAKLRHSGEIRNPEGRRRRRCLTDAIFVLCRSRVLQWSRHTSFEMARPN